MRTLTVFLVLILVCGCASENAKTPTDLCLAKCKQALSSNVDLSNGPCLSNQIAVDWVCDIAHSPRIEADNLLENRCEAFARGEAHHFVELDAECNVIQVY
ncbi:MAG: hypothetical protein FJY77_01160 [Candidatus Altiarchaeales archaeon]|nr:hypothetical protein [Candidatus Altiarchaeales archaeon]